MRGIRRMFRLPDGRNRVEQDVEAELAFHLAMREAKFRAGGLDPDDARRRARDRFGDVDAVRNECIREEHERRRKKWTVTTLGDLAGDFRFAFRAARRARTFTLTAVLTLALGIGAATAVFSVVNTTLIQPPPYPDADRIVRVFGAAGDAGTWQSPLSTLNLQDLRDHTRWLSALGGFVWNETTVTGIGTPFRAVTSAVYGDFFTALGTRPLIGRVLRPEENLPGVSSVAVVSYDFWQQHLGSTTTLEGRHLAVHGKVYDVVGVMPPGFRYPNRTEIWIGSFYTSAEQAPRNTYIWSGIGRLAPHATTTLVQNELDAVAKAIHTEYGETAGISGAAVVPLGEVLAGDLRTPLSILLGAVGLVLVIACVNLASVILARTESRRAELTVRAALGAGRGRLVRQILAESLVVALGGGAAGCGLAVLFTRSLAALGPVVTGLPSSLDVRVNVPILLGALVLSAACGTLIGLFPAIRASRVDLRDQLGAGGRAVTAGSARFRRPLVMAEVALALSLTVGATLLIRSVRVLMGGDPGFDPANVVTLDISLPEGHYSDSTSAARFFDRFFIEAAAIPGVEAVGMINSIPFGGDVIGGNLVIDQSPDPKGRGASYRLVNDGYFAALHIPLQRGRLFDRHDRAGSAPVAIVTQSFAKAFFPGTDPVGRRIKWTPRFDAHDDWIQVIGVAGNTKQFAGDDATEPAVYLPYTQRPERTLEGVTAVLRVRTMSAATLGAIRDVVRDIDAGMPVPAVSTMAAVMAQSVANRRFTTGVMVGFSVFALFLAALGLYSVLAYSVANRDREIGVRMAIGASRREILWLVVRDGMAAVLPGIVIGVAGAPAVAGVMRGMLYNVAPGDPTSLGVAVAALLVVGLCACAIPAHRAASIDPARAMRAE
jgi:putative ABC transport system permease protein